MFRHLTAFIRNKLKYNTGMFKSHGREATSPNLYPYVWLKFGGKLVFFQSILKQEGYVNMGMFFMSFSNMGTIFSIQHFYINYL